MIYTTYLYALNKLLLINVE